MMPIEVVTNRVWDTDSGCWVLLASVVGGPLLQFVRLF